MIASMILLALFNGFLNIISRVFNAKLGMYVSAAGAAFWNHFVGCLFLALIASFLAKERWISIEGIPFYLFLGGMVGACYVAINSFVLPKIGATKATVLVIAGQIVIGTMIDAANGKISNLNNTIIGIPLVILGVWVGNHKKANHSQFG